MRTCNDGPCPGKSLKSIVVHKTFHPFRTLPLAVYYRSSEYLKALNRCFVYRLMDGEK